MKRMVMTLGLIWLTGCFSGADEPQLTEPTNSGKNTLSCRVDGAIWNTGVPLFFTILAVDGSYDGQVFVLRGVKDDGKTFATMNISLDSITGTGEQLLTEAEYFTGARTYYIPQPGSVKVYLTTFDTTRRIASGTFEFAVADDSGHVAHITDGRFDVKFTGW